jgi:hypothetical protein
MLAWGIQEVSSGAVQAIKKQVMAREWKVEMERLEKVFKL